MLVLKLEFDGVQVTIFRPLLYTYLLGHYNEFQLTVSKTIEIVNFTSKKCWRNQYSSTLHYILSQMVGNLLSTGSMEPLKPVSANGVYLCQKDFVTRVLPTFKYVTFE